ncbi:MAG TPA: SMP-30/gluconolactonase/LRE family protein [Mycobacteriales bacterium]
MARVGQRTVGPPTLLLDGFGILESPVAGDDGEIYFSDVQAGGVFRLHGGNPETVIPHRRGIGGIARCRDGSLIVTGRNVARKTFHGTGTVLCENDPAGGVSSFNDVAVDRVGRVYVGALNLRPPTPDGVAGPASLVLVENDATVRVVATGLRFPNGLAFTGDAGDTWDAGGTGDTRETGRLLVVDSEFGSVLSYRVGVHGELSDRRIFAQWDDAVPDGLAVGRDGTVWVALAAGGGGFVDVLDPGGRSCHRIAFTESLVTNVAFGSRGSPRLYVTTGSNRELPGNGRLYVCEVDTPGVRISRAEVRPRGDGESETRSMVFDGS